MRKKGFFRLLTVSAVLVLLVSLCCFTVLGENAFPDVRTEVTEETSSEENSVPQESSSQITSSVPSESSVVSSEPSSEESLPSESSAPSESSSTESSSQTSSATPSSSEDEPEYSSAEELPEYYPPRDEGTNQNNSATGGSTGLDPSVSVGEDFGDDTNSDLVDDASVISSLPQQEETSSEASVGSADDSEVETTNQTSGNSGSSMLLVVGILLIVLGVAGLGTVVYLQFIAPKRAAKATKTSGQTFIPSDDDGYNVMHSDVDSKADTAEIDLNSHSEDDSEK